MYLKSLAVFGFKSFADKTSLMFQPGMTAIVGPNGCGKSNVADAVRWVLGEQSAKALRGGEMADVIFNGTDQRKSLGMAEVSLTIGDVDQEHLETAGVELNYNEVTISRRVFRDGGSEYYINRTPCRLKDIQQLFMGTGVGRASYSIMAQGNITQILSSKPEDRRMVFEEAAGITKFKAQKREALRKLDVTEQNLLRVGDLIREVKRQIGSLQRQAGKARRYKQLALELQHLDTQLARHQLDVLQAELAERQAALAMVRKEIEAASEAVLQDERAIAQLRDRLTELEHEISERQQQGLELRNQIDQHQSRIQFNHERQTEIEHQHAAALSEIAQAEERRRAAAQELAALNERLASAARTLQQSHGTLRARQAALQDLDTEHAARREATRQLQGQCLAVAQELTQLRNEIQALNLQKQSHSVRLDRLSAEKIQLEEERARLEMRLRDFTADVEAEKRSVESRRGSVDERQERLAHLAVELDQLNHQLEEMVQAQAGYRSRLHVLEQLQVEHEGYSAGAMAALQQTQQVLGSLADRLRVPEPYVAAIEAALGHHLQLVLTAEPEAAHQILTDLREGHKGRASVAPLSLLDGEAAGPNLPDLPERRPALALIEAEPSVRPLLGRLLGDTVVVSDLEAATASWRAGGHDLNYVTLAGELLTRHGVYTGGAANGHASGRTPSSILGRKNQIAELQEPLNGLQVRIEAASRQKGSLLGERTELQASLQTAQNALRAEEVAIAAHEGEVKALQQALQMAHQKIDTVVYEIQSLAGQEQEAQERRQALDRQAAAVEARDRDLQHQLQTATAECDRLQQRREAANAALTEARVAVAAEEQVASSLARQEGPLHQRLRELNQLVEQRRADIAAFLSRKTQAATESENSRCQIVTLSREREQLHDATAARISERDALAADVSGREDQLRERRRVLTERQDRRGALEVELAQQEMGAANLRERIQQKYHVRLDDVRSECITITFADQGPPRIKTLTPEEMAAAGVATDWQVVAEQVTALQQRLEEMGPVNLVAIEEYEETEQRYQFLTKQHDDLVKAKGQLVEVINRINTQTKEMFVETFNRIRESFRAMFTEVFDGGKADLRLVDEGDVLESGIDIVARPPGKQLQNISLLSGGEQTMTAVALLFAIYQVKPSPFCVLDELDAPLDESNINRFIRILQRFLKHSQFIIITHNKRTIGMADVLYGITMEEQGVIKIVGVKFHKSEAIVSEHRPAPLVPPPPAPPVEDEEDAPHTREETLEVSPA
jgi:chromosome segregation protein